jgi:hypothetical protein
VSFVGGTNKVVAQGTQIEESNGQGVVLLLKSSAF